MQVIDELNNHLKDSLINFCNKNNSIYDKKIIKILQQITYKIEFENLSPNLIIKNPLLKINWTELNSYIFNNNSLYTHLYNTWNNTAIVENKMDLSGFQFRINNISSKLKVFLTDINYKYFYGIEVNKSNIYAIINNNIIKIGKYNYNNYISVYIFENIIEFNVDNKKIYNSKYNPEALYLHAKIFSKNTILSDFTWIYSSKSIDNINDNSQIYFHNNNNNIICNIYNNILNKININDWQDEVISNNFTFDYIKGFKFNISTINKLFKIELINYSNNENIIIEFNNNNHIILYENDNRLFIGRYNINDIFEISLNEYNELLYIKNNILLYNNSFIIDINDSYCIKILLHDIDTIINNLLWITEISKLNEIYDNKNIKMININNIDINNNFSLLYSEELINFTKNINGIEFTIMKYTNSCIIAFIKQQKIIKEDESDIKYGLYLRDNNIILYLNGIKIETIGIYHINDIIKIIYNDKNIEFIKNNILLYKTTIHDHELNNNYYINLYIYNKDFEIKNIKWVSNNSSSELINLKSKDIVKFINNKYNNIYINDNKIVKLKNNNKDSNYSVCNSDNFIKLNDNNIRGIEFKISSISKYGTIGLYNIKEYNYMIFDNNNIIYINDNGNFSGIVGGYNINDIVQIRINSENKVEYIIDNILLYTSEYIINGNIFYYIKLSIYDSLFIIKDIIWIDESDFTFIKLPSTNKFINFKSIQEDILINNNCIKKILQDTIWSNFIISENKINLNNNSISDIRGIEFIILSDYKRGIVGINLQKKENLNWTNFEYGIYFDNYNNLEIYENNNSILKFYKYNINDKFQIRLNNYNKIEYCINNTLLYISKQLIDINDWYVVNISMCDNEFEIKELKWISNKEYMNISNIYFQNYKTDCIIN
jgi:hydrocephalus-inducing protein